MKVGILPESILPRMLVDRLVARGAVLQVRDLVCYMRAAGSSMPCPLRRFVRPPFQQFRATAMQPVPQPPISATAMQPVPQPLISAAAFIPLPAPQFVTEFFKEFLATDTVEVSARPACSGACGGGGSSSRQGRGLCVWC